MKRLGGLAVTLLFAAIVAGCTSTSPSGAAAQGGGPTSCGGSQDWPPLGYTASVPASVAITSRGSLGVRVTNSGDATVHVRVATWGLGSCTGWISFEPDRSADVPAHSSSDFALADPSSGIPFRVAVEVWSAACGESCASPPDGFWSGPMLDASPQS